ncbi:MAG: type II toxin-antitoxin system HicA family toxin [Candidatus Stahlbacteria bacterium]|nr:type II toxin-antitoxin system HicA family toxin [Candidatus Stahlbacteria bacterium]
MKEKNPRVTATQVIRVVEKKGFGLSRQSGSHKIYKNEKGIRITIPEHKGKILHPKILKSILKDLEISIREFKGLM